MEDETGIGMTTHGKCWRNKWDAEKANARSHKWKPIEKGDGWIGWECFECGYNFPYVAVGGNSNKEPKWALYSCVEYRMRRAIG